MKLLIALTLISFNALATEVLFVGDSLTCGAFGQGLTRLIAQEKEFPSREITTYCAVSSRPEHWIDGKIPAGQTCQTMSTSQLVFRNCGANGRMPTFAELLNVNRPMIVIIALGTNSLESSHPSIGYSKMIGLIPNGTKLIWIGPPHLRPEQARGFSTARLKALEANLEGFYTNLKNILKDAPLLDSRPFTIRGTSGGETVDGVHRGTLAGHAWANSMLGLLNQQL